MGHSQANMTNPNTKLSTCKIGMGLMPASRLFVRKSQKILGQKKDSKAATIWSVTMLASPSRSRLPLLRKGRHVKKKEEST